MIIEKIEGSDELYDDAIIKLNPDWFIYYYEDGGYDGNGVAAYKKDDKFHLVGLSHCSCYGATDGIETSIPYDSFEDIVRIAKEYDEGDKVISLIKEKYVR